MKNRHLVFSLLLLLSIVLLLSHLSRICNQIEVYRFDTGQPGPVVLIVAGTHGNEPAGRLLLQQWISSESSEPSEPSEDNEEHPTPLSGVKRGTLLLVPCANRSGCALGSRWMWHNLFHRDLNRNYTEEGTEPVSQQIIQLIRREHVDFIVDLHEGWGFHLQDQRSIGSTLTPTTDLSREIAKTIVQSLNQTIPDPSRHFTVRDETDHLLTLRNFARRNGLNYLLVETTGIDDVQPLPIRMQQVHHILSSVLDQLGITVITPH